MSLAATLFGGVAAIVLLYYLLGALKLSHYWRGVVSCLLPLTAYAVYFTRHSPGGDVLSVHVAVYLATAGMLTVLGLRKREAEARLHWAPLVLAGFFAAVIIIQAVLLVISTHGLPDAVTHWFLPKTERTVHTAFPGVVPHSQDAAKSVSQFLKQEDLRKRTGWQIELNGVEDPHRGEARPVAVRIVDRDGQPVQEAVPKLQVRPTALGGESKQVQLQAGAPGRYAGLILFPEPGPWMLTLVIEAQGQRYEAQQVVNVAP